MASGPYPDPRRGTWSVQWFDGSRWRRTKVADRPPGWKPGQKMPAKPPAEARAALVELAERERLARRGYRIDPGESAADFLRAYADAYKLSHANGSHSQLLQAIRSFLGWCEGAKVDRLAKVDAAACGRWIEWRAAQTSRKTGRPISFARLSQERALLAAAWAKAVRRGQLDRNPWLPVEVPARPTREKKPSWTPEEYERLLGAAAPWLKLVLTMGCHTGLRISALLAMEWSWVDWSAGTLGRIVVPPGWDKAGKGYGVPLHSNAHDALARARLDRRAGEGHVILGARGRPSTGTITWVAIRRCCGRAGLPAPPSANHAMRRTFGRWAVLGQLTGRPVPLYVVSRWMGHSSVKMTEEYLDLHVDASDEWMAEMGPIPPAPPPSGTPPPASGP